MTGQELLLGGGGLVALLTIIQVSDIKINPWSAIGRGIGRAINGEVLAKVDALEKDVQGIEDEIKKQAAVNSRARILRFADEVLHGGEHTKDHFDQTLADIDEYERFCKEHPDFTNNKTALAAERIKSVYLKLLDRNDFL